MNTIFLVSEDKDEHNREIVGFAVMKISSWNNTASLVEFAVRKDMKRIGMGNAIIGEIRRVASIKGLRSVIIETQPGNREANEFYSSIGLRICGYNDRYYSNRPESPNDIAIFYSLDIARAGNPFSLGPQLKNDLTETL